ncbi:MAG: hypothetical protein LBK83_09340 [Treponema sp.]|nr:hypothetical protein [Treponema sp.]
MKRVFFMMCAFVFLMTAGCSLLQDVLGGQNEQGGQDDPGGQNDPGGQTDPGGKDNPGGSIYAETYWGEWIRMDANETWYISGGAIKVNGAVRSASVSLVKQSDRVIQVTEGGRKYYLYASRIANTSFTGKIAGFEEAAPSIQRSVAGGKGWINVVVEDLNNGSTQTVQTDDAGEFTVEDAIPGDSYEITPEGGTPVTVTPQGDGDDVGTITVTDGVNFKTSITENDGAPFLYANGTRYDFIIEAANVGTEDCLAATYQLSFEDGSCYNGFHGKNKMGNG